LVRAATEPAEGFGCAAPGAGASAARERGYEIVGAGPAPLASFSDYAGLHAALRAAREMRNISFDTLDEIVGAPKGYFSKVLAPRGERKLTMQSMGWALNGLGLQCLLVDDPEMLEQIKNRLEQRDGKVVRSNAVHIVLSTRFLREIGRKGAEVSNARRRQRKEAARHAALARWHGRNGGGR
jgi:hypothetical protein